MLSVCIRTDTYMYMYYIFEQVSVELRDEVVLMTVYYLKFHLSSKEKRWDSDDSIFRQWNACVHINT